MDIIEIKYTSSNQSWGGDSDREYVVPIKDLPEAFINSALQHGKEMRKLVTDLLKMKRTAKALKKASSRKG